MNSKIIYKEFSKINGLPCIEEDNIQYIPIEIIPDYYMANYMIDKICFTGEFEMNGYDRQIDNLSNPGHEFFNGTIILNNEFIFFGGHKEKCLIGSIDNRAFYIASEQKQNKGGQFRISCLSAFDSQSLEDLEVPDIYIFSNLSENDFLELKNLYLFSTVNKSNINIELTLWFNNTPGVYIEEIGPEVDLIHEPKVRLLFKKEQVENSVEMPNKIFSLSGEDKNEITKVINEDLWLTMKTKLNK